MADVDLLCLTRCYRRTDSLADVANLILHEIPNIGVSTFLVFAPDPRANEAVLKVVDAYSSAPNVIVVKPTFPVLSPQHGQKWIEVLNEMSDAFDAAGHTARWLADMDDDIAFSQGWEEHLLAMLHNDRVLAYKAISLFLWDEQCTQVNTRQHHWSPWLGRYAKGARRRTNREIRVLDWVQVAIENDFGKMKVMPFYLLDSGSSTENDRQHCYRACARAGKLDDYTRKYIEEPRLAPLAEIMRQFPDPHDFETWQREALFGV